MNEFKLYTYYTAKLTPEMEGLLFLAATAIHVDSSERQFFSHMLTYKKMGKVYVAYFKKGSIIVYGDTATKFFQNAFELDFEEVPFNALL